MPGEHDVWIPVTLAAPQPASTETIADATPAATGTATTSTATTSPAPHRARRRMPLVAGLVVASLAVTGGAYAVSTAYKDVTLDVDGHVTTISTFAGSVQNLLDAQGVRLTERDLVSPATDAALTDGADVVVRFARELTVHADGEEVTAWVTALDAHEALTSLAARGTDVALVASRSGERASLALRLDADGPVAVVADGDTTVVGNGRDGLAAVLAEADVTLEAADTVRVVSLDAAGIARADAQGADVAVVVQRIVEEDVTTEHALPFETETKDDSSLYKGESKVVQEGADGVRTLVERVVTVDGEETSRTVVSDEITTQPVAKVVAEGTKERPVVAAAPAVSGGGSTGPVMSGSPRAIGQELAAARGWTGDQWQCLDSLFQKESGWNPSAQNRSSGAYGIPQALPGSKMGTVAGDWRTNPATQITWGLNYIEGRYGSPCGAWGHSQSVGWY
ncbi:G5 domain protein [Xylanimonas cellulosilytica DSM 15894]|uniref:G5 domain protein n=1 Tax=Xylanimonas cellulosilytica (strain DSM 15894 / JCM 12276 / CECT 5975 / KCTC 9989 / LMG 20990 / NBRC 107835 / XIL07) TaxID=446471 RepID=D1BXU9_XYLCX|nr:G5 domain-containing protein [Xylanimonas cellulosilytica]ACZ31740.1 G5 domain protein [Xylanimonas cellulosilytica DSM 15894]